MTVNNVTTIACDESGSEGETFMRAFEPVFIHASVSIGIDEASGILAQLRADTGTRALEIKSSQMLKPGNRQSLRLS